MCQLYIYFIHITLRWSWPLGSIRRYFAEIYNEGQIYLFRYNPQLEIILYGTIYRNTAHIKHYISFFRHFLRRTQIKSRPDDAGRCSCIQNFKFIYPVPWRARYVVGHMISYRSCRRICPIRLWERGLENAHNCGKLK